MGLALALWLPIGWGWARHKSDLKKQTTSPPSPPPPPDFKYSLKYVTLVQDFQENNGLVSYWTAGRVLYPIGIREGWSR